MGDSGDTKAGDFGEMTLPSVDVFSDEAFGETASNAVRDRSDLDKGHIRLFKIQSGGRDSVIRCLSQIFPLECTDEYTALSYTWGSTLLSQPIEMDGHRRLIPRNLWRFLRQARQCSQQLSGWLWIDVLSIDQACAWERTHQVNIMSDIFRNAKTVVVWAGQAYRESDKAFEAISKAKSYNKKVLTRICSGPLGSAIQNFCERPYWRRLWVFQELKFARNIVLMCGERFLPWSRFEGFLLHIRNEDGVTRLKDKVNAMSQSPAGAMVELTMTSLDTSLWSLLLATKHLRCADPHDKVYALLSVAESGHEGISADYSMPLSVLLNRVLRNMHTLLPPKELAQAATQCKTLESLFGVSPDTIFDLSHRPSQAVGEACYYPSAYKLGPSRYSFSLWWTDLYGHTEMQRLLLQAWDYHWFKGSRCPEPEEIQATRLVLTRSRFDVNASPLGYRHLQMAIHHGNLATLKLLLALPNLNIDIKNSRGESPLHQAVATGRTKIVRALIASGSYKASRHLKLDSEFWAAYKTMPRSMRAVLVEAMTSETTLVSAPVAKREIRAIPQSHSARAGRGPIRPAMKL